MPKYYLISYYARLPQGGFGFARTYWATDAVEEFNLEQFEAMMAAQSNLKKNDICLISRIPVTVEEYNLNTNKQKEEIFNKHSGKEA